MNLRVPEELDRRLERLAAEENIRNPARSDQCTAESDAQSVHIVHIVHTPFF
jgi:hypothetical protein